MNIRKTKSFFEKNGIVPLKADIDTSTAAEELLKELGNSAAAIPYYAIFGPGLDQPIHFDAGGVTLSVKRVHAELEKALQAKALAEQEAAALAEQEAATEAGQVAATPVVISGGQ